MKILVECKDGEKRVVTLVPPITELHDGEHLCSFHCGDGTDHFFTPDGYYDGMGRCVVGLSEQEVKDEIERMKERP